MFVGTKVQLFFNPTKKVQVNCLLSPPLTTVEVTLLDKTDEKMLFPWFYAHLIVTLQADLRKNLNWCI